MKKKVLFILFICLLTGCSANYTLNINNESFKETININVDKKQITNTHDAENILYLEQNEIPVFKNDQLTYYRKTINKNGSKINANLYFEYKGKEFENSRVIQECFSNNIFLETENSYYIKLYGDFNCNFVENYNLSLNIVTNNKVLKNNADNIYKNKYTWNINVGNDSEKVIEFQVSKKVDDLKENGSFLSMGIILIISFLILSIITWVIFKKIMLKNN